MDQAVVDLNIAIRLAKRPSQNYPHKYEDIFQMVSIPPVPTDQVSVGSVIVRNKIISISQEIANRIAIKKGNADHIQVGSCIKSQAIGEVIFSKGQIPVGSLVVGNLGWQKYAVIQQNKLLVLPSNQFHPQTFLHIFTPHSLSAYIGLFQIAKIQQGQTVVVSGDGLQCQIAVQLAKNHGCTVYAVVDSDEKAKYYQFLGAKFAINYKNASFEKQLKENCKNGFDVCLDFMGGQVFDEILMNIKDNSRLVLGGKSILNKQYKIKNYPRLIIKKCFLQGFKYEDYQQHFINIVKKLGEMIVKKRLTFQNQWYYGIQECPMALKRIINKQNVGNILVKVQRNDNLKVISKL